MNWFGKKKSSPQKSLTAFFLDYKIKTVHSSVNYRTLKTQETNLMNRKPDNCPKHPRYRGVGKPTSNCVHCWMMYLLKHPDYKQIMDRDRRVNQRSQEVSDLKGRYSAALERIDDLERLLHFESMVCQPPKIIKIATPKADADSYAVPIIVASDWHVEERVDRSTINGLNEFDLEIAERRASFFFSNSLRLVRMFNQDVKIDTIVLALLGDFVTNYLHDENRETNLLGPSEALIFVKDLLYSGIKFLLENSNYRLVIPCCYGNHGRLTQKMRHGNIKGTSLELLIYKWLFDIFKDEPRVQFDVAGGQMLIADIVGRRIRFHHGDLIRYQGGVGGITIPLNKAIAQLNKATQVKLDVIGHWHQFLFGRNYLINGSLIGYNAFAQYIKADFEEPNAVLNHCSRQPLGIFNGRNIQRDNDHSAGSFLTQ